MMWGILYFGIPAVIALWTVYRFDLSGWQVLALSYLPTLLFGLYGLGALACGGGLGWEMLLSPLYFSLVAYAFVFPALIATSLVTVLFQKSYQPKLWQSILVGACVGMLSIYTMEYIRTQDMRYFDWSRGLLAMVLGALSVAIMYGFMRYRSRKEKI